MEVVKVLRTVQFLIEWFIREKNSPFGKLPQNLPLSDPLNLAHPGDLSAMKMAIGAAVARVRNGG
jgi:hypothetical protein